MKNRIKLGCFSVIMLSVLTACSTAKTDTADLYKGESPKQLFENGESSLRDGSYGDAAKRFEAMDVLYPYDQHAEQADLYLIYAYYMKGEYLLASSAADRFIRLHPTNAHVDYAYYLRGLSHFYENLGVFERMFAIDLSKRDLASMQKSFADFNELVLRFPTSRYTPSAHQYMVYLRNVMAKHELTIAKFYYNRKAYMAAANRASIVVTQFQGAPSVVDALGLMVNAYKRLHLTKLEADTLAVYQFNYSNRTIDDVTSYDMN